MTNRREPRDRAARRAAYQNRKELLRQVRGRAACGEIAVVWAGLTLSPARSGWTAHCPFHAGRKPGLHPDGKLFRCHGESGDAAGDAAVFAARSAGSGSLAAGPGAAHRCAGRPAISPASRLIGIPPAADSPCPCRAVSGRLPGLTARLLRHGGGRAVPPVAGRASPECRNCRTAMVQGRRPRSVYGTGRAPPRRRQASFLLIDGGTAGDAGHRIPDPAGQARMMLMGTAEPSAPADLTQPVMFPADRPQPGQTGSPTADAACRALESTAQTSGGTAAFPARADCRLPTPEDLPHGRDPSDAEALGSSVGRALPRPAAPLRRTGQDAC